jgi:hypothetical protein
MGRACVGSDTATRRTKQRERKAARARHGMLLLLCLLPSDGLNDVTGAGCARSENRRGCKASATAGTVGPPIAPTASATIVPGSARRIPERRAPQRAG